MAKGSAAGTDLANVILTGTFTATGQSLSTGLMGYYNFFVWGTPLSGGLSGSFSGTVQLEKSFDGGTTWIPASLDTAGDAAAYTSAVSVTGLEIEPGMLYRVDCTAYTSGTINYRLSQTNPPSLPLFKI